MKKFFYLFCAGALLLAGGCSDDESERERRIAFADIVDAECLYLTGKSGTRASDEDEVADPALYKVTFDGTTEKVIFTDENGKPVDTEVRSFRRLSDDYIYVCLKLYYEKRLIIRRSDGAVFQMPGYYSIKDNALIQTDSSGNLYCQIATHHIIDNCSSTTYPIYKIYPQGNELYLTQINRDDMYVPYDDDHWLVDRRGNVLINDGYIRLASGEFARHSAGWIYFCFYAWNDSEGFYRQTMTHTPIYNGHDYDNRYNYHIMYCRPTSPTSTFEEIKTFENLEYCSFNPLVYTDKTVLFDAGGKYRIDIYNKDRIELHEMEPHTLPDGIGFGYYGQKYPHTEKYLYGRSGSEIWRLSVETGEPEMLYKYDDEFVFKSMTVRNSIVTFKAFDLRSGNDVIAEIYPDKTVKVLASTNGDKIIQFERLN